MKSSYLPFNLIPFSDFKRRHARYSLVRFGLQELRDDGANGLVGKKAGKIEFRVCYSAIIRVIEHVIALSNSTPLPPLHFQKPITPSFQPHLESSTCEILALIQRELEESQVKIDQMFFGGFSMGAHLAAWTAYHLPVKPAGIIMFSGLIFGLSELCPVFKDIDILQCHGTEDNMIPMIGAQMVQGQMQSMGLCSNYK